MMHKPIHEGTIPVTKGGGNVFADLGLRGAGDLQIKAELTRQVCDQIKALGLTNAQAAKRLGVKAADARDLALGRHTGFSLDRLVAILNDFDVDIEIVFRPRAGAKKGRPRAGLRLIAAGR